MPEGLTRESLAGLLNAAGVSDNLYNLYGSHGREGWVWRLTVTVLTRPSPGGASDIRRGNCTPHVSTWAALAGTVGVVAQDVDRGTTKLAR